MFNHVRLSSLTATLGAALLAATVIPQLRASDIDNMTTMTFSAPIEISGHNLPAGTYVFKTRSNNRDMVVIMNSEDNHLVALLQTIPIDTPVVSDTTRVELSQGAANGPEVMHAWFYPGQITGWEFLAAKTGGKIAAVSPEQ
jgi:hypothetical protein